MSDNLSVVLHRVMDIRVEGRQMPPEPEEGEVRLRMDSVGICGSDVHYYVDGGIGDWKVRWFFFVEVCN